jgi:hypothetical protein
MFKKIIRLITFVWMINVANAQEMNGFRTDNYNGVHGAFFNPANIGNSPYKLDVGLVGLNIFAGNKNLDFSFNTFSDLSTDTNVLNSFVGNGKTNSIMVNAQFHLPSISYKVNDKIGIAFLLRSRILLCLQDIDGTLINSIRRGATNPALPYQLNGTTNMRLSANAFSEYAVAGSYVAVNEGLHFLKVGGTIKYLAGVGNSYLQLDKINATLDTISNGNAVATKASGSIAYAVGGVEIVNPSLSLAANASGIGADLGIVYEYRPDHLKNEHIPYLLKANTALLDLGSINYKVIPNQTAGYTINIPAGQNFDLSKLDRNYKDTLVKYSNYFSKISPESSYRVSLPRTLQLGLDYRAIKNVFVAANVQLAISNNESKAYNPKAVNAVTITPRYEGKLLAAYLPINFSNLSKTSIGFGLRAGPLFVGSSSLISLMISNSKQMDFYFGFRFGFKTKKDIK